MTRAVVAILALFILATAMTFGFQATLEAAGDDHSVTNESFTPDAGNITTLNNSNIEGAFYDETVTVHDENDTLVTADGNYTWFHGQGNGTIKTTQGGELDGDSTANITYNWTETTADQREFTTLLSKLPQLLGLIAPALVVFLFLVLLRG